MKATWVFNYGLGGASSPISPLPSSSTLTNSGKATWLHKTTPATLRGFRLGATTALVPDREAAVRGVLHAMSGEELEVLDAAEENLDGNGFACLRTRRSVRDASGRRRKAWVYLRPCPLAGGGH